ncbi:MAG TPA: DUF5694 domain-containing protein [Puia sp.]|jgi:hypothetical protein|nr:DUF5694 domain-containing protein [Puia sp.]
MQLSNSRCPKAVNGLLFLLLLSTRSQSQENSAPLPQKIKVYLVGTFHFDGATGDVYKTSREDMKTPENQRQLDDLARRLVKASPDRVFVEWTMDRQGYVDTTYQLYLRNEFELGNNEVYQVGYRLGRLLKHQRIYCADAGGDFEYDSLVAYAVQHHQADILTDLNHPRDSIARQISARIGAIYSYYQSPQGHSLTDVIISNNTPEVIASGADLYNLVYARVGEGQEYPGADLASDFYKRNMRIYTNILRQIDIAHDKAIMVYIGSGHVSFLKEIFSSSLLFEVEDIVPLLKEP